MKYLSEEEINKLYEDDNPKPNDTLKDTLKVTAEQNQQEENNKQSKEDLIEKSEKLSIKDIISGTIGLIIIGAVIYGFMGDKIEDHKTDKQNKKNALEYYEKAGPIYYNKCIKEGGSHSFCEEYTARKSADDLIRASK